jgi:polyphosphate kinase 1
MSYYINRELSWLKFNKRVLEQAASNTVPAFEKLKFVSIFSSNLDEFFMVRVGSMLDRSLIGDNLPDDKTGMTASEQLALMYEHTRPLYKQYNKHFKNVCDELKLNGVTRLDIKNLTPEQTKFVKQYFKKEIQPLISPQIIDTKHPFPHLENKRLYVLLSLKKNSKSYYGIIPITQIFQRILFVDGDGLLSYVLIEDIIMKYAGTIFKQYTISARAVAKITRNADIEVEDNFSDDDIDYRDYVKIIVKKREKLMPTRMEIYTGSYSRSAKMIRYFMERLKLTVTQCYNSDAPLDMSYVFTLEDKLAPLVKRDNRLLYRPLTPRNLQFSSSVTEAAYKQDIFLSYPYYSMKPYLRLLDEAANDSDTVSIKITLYRLSRNSEVIRLLCLAAENGKSVTVIVELKARFDETNNINWSRQLEEAGCHVIYGLESLKVHSKITLITRKTDDKISHITHIATGNYNEKTALLYTDLGIITTNSRICNDAVNFFNNMTLGNSDTDDYEALIVSPVSLKQTVIELIRNEKSYIFMKMNGLTDKNIIDELVKASQSGVKIDLVVRGVCCLQSGIEGVSDNICIRSIVGRFLEHSRIAIFGDDPETRKVYIGSADLMTRNTMRRVEIWVPVFDKKIADTISGMAEITLADNVKASILCSDSTYERIINSNPPLDSQIYFYEGDGGYGDARF